ncbi:FAD-binding protein, partial [Variovorax paradoxus]
MTDFTTTPPSSSNTPDRTPRRVRHDLRFRQLTVKTVQRVTPHLIRVVLTGDDLAGFTSPGFDDHAKIFFPEAATGKLTLPT